MSLSLRGVARDVRFVTAHSRRGAALDMDWSSLARGGSTLAFYMGREAAGEIRRGLMQAGMPGEMPVMIACEVSGPGERRLVPRSSEERRVGQECVGTCRSQRAPSPSKTHTHTYLCQRNYNTLCNKT